MTHQETQAICRGDKLFFFDIIFFTFSSTSSCTPSDFRKYVALHCVPIATRWMYYVMP